MDVTTLFDLTGKRALVTGASVGIGRMIAGGLAAAGATVYLVARGQNDLEDFTRRDWEDVTRLCLTVPFFLTQALLPSLRAAASLDDPARVINIGSADGIKAPFLSTYPYPAAKAGLHHLTRQLGKVLGPEGIAVNAIAPGAFPSRRSAPVLAEHLDDFIEATPLRRIGRPDDMAGTVIYLASRAGAFLDGAVLSLDGGLVL